MSSKVGSMAAKVAPLVTAEKVLREAFPDGHKDFIPMALEEIKLHSYKNYDYAFGGKPTGNFDRVAEILAMYPGLKLRSAPVVAIVYLLKQLDSALWLQANGHSAKVEGAAERWMDIAVYAKLISILDKEDQ